MKRPLIKMNKKRKQLTHNIKDLYQGDFGDIIEVDITDIYMPGWRYEMLVNTPSGELQVHRLYFPDEDYIPEVEPSEDVLPEKPETEVPDIEVPDIEDNENPPTEDSTESVEPAAVYGLEGEDDIDSEMGVEHPPIILKWYVTKKLTKEWGWHNIQLRGSLELQAGLDPVVEETASIHSAVSPLYINQSLV
mgnify:CR=1 FL=1